MESREIFERAFSAAQIKANSIQDYYNIPPEEVVRLVFDDAMVLFSTETGEVISSRAPAALFVPGEDISRCADVLATIKNNAPNGEIFGAQKYKCKDLPRESRRLGLEDTFYLRRSPAQPDLALAFFGVHRAGLGKLPCVLPPYPSTLPNWSDSAADVLKMGSPYNNNTFFAQVAGMTRRIAYAVGSGIALNDRCRDFVILDNFNAYAYFAVILALVMFFRRNAMRRGFNMTVCSPTEDLCNPYFVFSAELYGDVDLGEPKDLAAIAKIAASRGVDLEYGVVCQNKTRRVHIYFSPFIPEIISEDLKSLGVWGKKERTPFNFADTRIAEGIY